MGAGYAYINRRTINKGIDVNNPSTYTTSSTAITIPVPISRYIIIVMTVELPPNYNIPYVHYVAYYDKIENITTVIYKDYNDYGDITINIEEDMLHINFTGLHATKHVIVYQ